MPRKNILALISPGGWRFWLILALVCTYAAGVQWIDDHGFPAKKVLDADSAVSVSVIMGLLMVFRTNSAYDRWWEGRKLWGQLTNDLRNLSVKSREFANLDHQESNLLAELLTGFANSMRHHLRGNVVLESIPEMFRSNLERKKHIPLAIAGIVIAKVRSWNKSGRLSDTDLLVLDPHIRGLMDVCGGCERIIKTPISLAYKMMIWIGQALYLAFLPWVLVPTYDNLTVWLVGLSAYFALGLESLAEEVEDPFGMHPNDLPLDSICQGIEVSVKEALID
ncbi:MAG: hypothetical protein K2W95_29830 [Candidatus Obscuribacterales bacterium]|nr:hypothetical protein [Candidatus Obscuribacterales bacterium]